MIKESAASCLKSKRVTLDILGNESHYRREMLGFTAENGVIKSMPAGYWFLQAMEEEVRWMQYLPEAGKTVIVAGNSLYVWKEEQTPTRIMTASGGIPTFWDLPSSNLEAVRMILGSKAYAYRISVGNASPGNAQQTVNCGTVHYDRLFINAEGEPYVVRWSMLNKIKWDEGIDNGGHVDLGPEGGAIKRLFSVGEKVIVLREGGIDAIVGYSDARHFIVKKYRGYNVGVPVPEAALSVGGEVWFCTKDKLYCFNGATLEEKPLNINVGKFTIRHLSLIDARYFYLTVALSETSKLLLRYDSKTGITLKCSDEVFTPWRAGDKMYCISGQGICEFMDRLNTMSYWRSIPIDFESGDRKILKWLEFDCDNNVRMIVNFDEKSTQIIGPYRGRLEYGGKSFWFRIFGEGEVRSFKLVFEVPA